MSDTPCVRGGLWTCPKCGRKFVGRNMWHACGDYSVEKFLEGIHHRRIRKVENIASGW